MRRIVLFMALVLANACSESSAESNPDQPPGELAACTARAPAIEGTTFPREALPSGDCANAGERCAMRIGYPCTGGGIGRVDQAQCTCTEGKWSCAVTGAGSSSCPAAPNDASAD